eukprot:6186317-Pleurochrysis_carterae.AAC.2
MARAAWRLALDLRESEVRAVDRLEAKKALSTPVSLHTPRERAKYAVTQAEYAVKQAEEVVKQAESDETRQKMR